MPGHRCAVFTDAGLRLFWQERFCSLTNAVRRARQSASLGKCSINSSRASVLYGQRISYDRGCPQISPVENRPVAASFTLLLRVATLAWVGLSGPVHADGAAPTQAVAEGMARTLATACPVVNPGDQQAFERCRDELRQSNVLVSRAMPYILWGGGPSDRHPKDLSLSQFGGELFQALYLPLFMFTGVYAIDDTVGDGLIRVRFETSFRNRLMPGLYPYPFWHSADKWKAYEAANEIVAFISKDQGKIVALLRSDEAHGQSAVVRGQRPTPAFDGKWMWTDAQGRIQPMVTLFDGYFSADNPGLLAVDRSFRDFATTLRDAECLTCHVPNNPYKMKRLVLLQTPLHAAAEIVRALDDVRKDRMPRDDIGDAKPLAALAKASFLSKGQAFADALVRARDWERSEGRLP